MKKYSVQLTDITVIYYIKIDPDLKFKCYNSKQLNKYTMRFN